MSDKKNTSFSHSMKHLHIPIKEYPKDSNILTMSNQPYSNFLLQNFFPLENGASLENIISPEILHFNNKALDLAKAGFISEAISLMASCNFFQINTV